MADIRPTPEQRPVVGGLARLLQRADEFARKPFGYENPPAAMLSDFLSIPPLYRTMENYAYGSPLASGTSSVSRYLPRLTEDTKGAIEGAINLTPMVGPAARATTAGATALGRLGERAAAKAVPQIMERRGVGADLLSALASGTTSNVIKPKGGNWLVNEIEWALKPLRSRVVGEEPAERLKKLEDYFADQRAKGVALDYSVIDRERARMAPDVAINRWIDTKLNKYIRNEMATPEDPVRALAEQGTTHLPMGLVGAADVVPIGKMRLARTKAGFPAEGMGQSPAARAWESSADYAIKPRTAGSAAEYDFNVEDMPWLKKLDPETPVYGIPNASYADLGFPHLIDELKAAMSPTSELPQHLRLDPKDIDKVTVPQAVERVSKINAWRAEEAARAEKAGMMENLQATPRLADENLQLSFVEKPGGAWVDIPETTNKEGLKICTSIGKAGGWCTKNEGLALDYGSGENRLATLLDSEGRPHAQAKIRSIPSTGDIMEDIDDVMQTMTAAERKKFNRYLGSDDFDGDHEEALGWLRENLPAAYKRYVATIESNAPPDITELKPPGNNFNSDRAKEYIKRDPDYKAKVTDSVLNFLNSGQWGSVSDLHHYDIVDLQRGSTMLQAYLSDILPHKLPFERKDLFNAAIDANPNLPRFMTPQQLRDLVRSVEPPGYAEGGMKKPSPFDDLEPTFGQRMGAAAADKLTEAGLWLYDKLAEREGLSSAHKIYLDTFVHDKRDPITAKDFNPQDLVELQNLIQQKEKLTGNKGKGYIQYQDYKTLPGGDQRRGVPANLIGGVLPPRLSLGKSLGQFNYERDPKTGQFRIIDEYDFNPQHIKVNGEKVEVPLEFYGDYVEDAGFSPYALARLYGGRKMPPGKGRKVELAVPGKARGGAVDYDPDEIAKLAASVMPGYAAGGLVDYDPTEIDTIVSQLKEELHG